MGVMTKHLAYFAPGQVAHVVVVARVIAPVTQRRFFQNCQLDVLGIFWICHFNISLHLARLISVHRLFSCESLKKTC